MKKIGDLVVLLLLLPLVFWIGRISGNGTYGERKMYYRDDEDLVNAAFAAESRSDGLSVENMRQMRSAVAIHMGSLICVELRPKEGIAAGSPVYCFDRASRKLLKDYQDVE